MTNEALIAEARERIGWIEEGDADFGAWERLANMAGPLADALEAATLTAAEDLLYVRRMEAERDAALAVIEQVKVARSNHPECAAHPDDDVITCGWKRAVLDIDASLAKATS